MRAKRAAKGDENTDPYRIIVASPPYQAIATSASWESILEDWTWMEHHLFPLGTEHGVEAVVVAVKAIMDADDVTAEEALPKMQASALAALQTSEDDPPSLLISRLVDEATTAMWNSQFADANEALHGHENDGPRERFTLAQVYMLQALRSGEPELTRASIQLMADAAKAGEAFAKDAGAVQEQAARLAAEAGEEGRVVEPESPEMYALVAAVGFDARIVGATARLNQALLLSRSGSRTGAAFQLRKGWKAFSSALDEIEAYNQVHAVPLDPGLLASVKYGLGLFYFLLSLIRPGMGKTMLGALGMHGDTSRGMEYLSEVAAGEYLASPHAAIIILSSIVYVPQGVMPHPERLIMAQQLIDKNAFRFPGGTVFSMLNAALQRLKGDADAAVAAISAAIETIVASGSPIPANYTMELAESLLFAGDHAAAAEALAPFVASVVPFENRGFATLMLAAAQVGAGNVEAGAVTLALVPGSVDKKSAYDAAALALSSWYLEMPGNLSLLPYEFQYVKQHFYSINPTRALELANGPMSSATLDPSLVQGDPIASYKASLLRGVLYTTGGEFDAASNAFDAATALESQIREGGVETRLFSYMAFERTRLAYLRGDDAALAACVDALSSTKIYKGDESLVRRCETTLAELSAASSA